MATAATHPATANFRPRAEAGALEPRGPARFIADPAAVGLAAFALTTMTLGVINIGLVPTAVLPVVFPIALAYGGVLQLLAGMWAFIRGDTFAAVGFGSYGAFWLSFWALNAFFLKQIPVADQATALTVYLAMWGFFTFWLWIASFGVAWSVNAVLGTLVVAYLLLALGKADGSLSVYHVGGGFTMATAACAWYTTCALTLEKVFGRAILPIGAARKVQQDVPGT
jgi:succinate-acetate transporter protein